MLAQGIVLDSELRKGREWMKGENGGINSTNWRGREMKNWKRSEKKLEEKNASCSDRGRRSESDITAAPHDDSLHSVLRDIMFQHISCRSW